MHIFAAEKPQTFGAINKPGSLTIVLVRISRALLNIFVFL